MKILIYHIAKSNDQSSNRLNNHKDLTIKDSDLKEVIKSKKSNRNIIHTRNELNRSDIKDRSSVLYHSSLYYNGIKIGRNEICPCGSGLKFKKCHINKSK